MKTKVICDDENDSFIFTKYRNYSISIQEFVEGEGNAMVVLNRKEAKELKKFLDENLK